MHGLLEQILSSPRLIDFQSKIDSTLELERKARQRFRDRLGEERREEFVNGEVVEQLATQLQHALCLQYLQMLIATFVRLRKLGLVLAENALVQFPRNDYCPDLCYWSASKDVAAQRNRMVFPAPDFVIEILSASTAYRDRGIKFEDYEAHGVKEYWIVDPEMRTIEQFIESAGIYQPHFSGTAGIVKSAVIAGFEMPAEAAFDDAVQMKTLQQILAAG